jgi:probable HAF family extracellular repeat protein
MIRSKPFGVLQLAVVVLTGYACSDRAPTAVSSTPRGLPSPSSAISSDAFIATDLGTLGGTSTSSSIALDINSTGTVVGESSNAESKTLAFIWTRQTGMVSLGLASPTDAFSRATAINDAGWIVGQSGSRPALWKPGQPPIYLETSGLGGTATDINNSGVVVGIIERNGLHGFRWENGVFQELIPLSGEPSRAFGINIVGDIVGGANDATTHIEQPAKWDPAASWVSLGILEALNGRRGAATSINNKGEIVGFFFPQSGQLSPFVFRPGSGATALASGAVSGTANAINDASQIVGQVGADAILWDPSAVMVSLPKPVGTSGVANSINGSNQIVGRITLASGQSRATLWELKPNVSPVARLDSPTSGMKKKPLIFSAEQSTDSDGDPLMYSWDFGDGSSAATGPRVTHEFDDWGKYTVTVTVTDPSGNSATASAIVTIAPPGQLKRDQ